MIARGFSLFAISVSASFVSGMSGVVIGRWVRSSGMGGRVAVGVGVAALVSVVLAWLVGRFGDRHPVRFLYSFPFWWRAAFLLAVFCCIAGVMSMGDSAWTEWQAAHDPCADRTCVFA